MKVQLVKFDYDTGEEYIEYVACDEIRLPKGISAFLEKDELILMPTVVGEELFIKPGVIGIDEIRIGAE